MLVARSAVRNGFLKVTFLSLFGALLVSTDRHANRRRRPVDAPRRASPAHMSEGEYAKPARFLQRYSKRGRGKRRKEA
jgi:hypothetical protein